MDKERYTKTEEHKRRLSLAQKGIPRGYTWNKGISPSEETRAKMSIAQKARDWTGWAPTKGMVFSLETREKMRRSHLENPPSLKARAIMSDAATRHGLSRTRAYGSWRNMWARCRQQSTPNYPNYGGRGITVCDRWLKFENFFADMGERPEGKTLDRKDSNGNYELENCRWATRSEQQINRRKKMLTGILQAT